MTRNVIANLGLGVILIAALSLFFADANAGGELRLSAYACAPGESRVWENAGSAEFQLVLGGQHGGLALALGFGEWTPKQQFVAVMNSNYGIASEITGRLGMVPIGASLFLRPTSGSKVNLALEGGIRFILMNSEIQGGFEYWDRYNYVASSGKIEIGTAVVGLIAADLEFNVEDNAYVFIGGGSQPTISKGKAMYFDQEIGEIDFSVSFFRFGIGGSF